MLSVVDAARADRALDRLSGLIGAEPARDAALWLAALSPAERSAVARRTIEREHERQGAPLAA